MNILIKGIIVSSALALGIATQASVASAAVFCRAFWPATFSQCENGADGATAAGSNIAGANNRGLSVFLTAGTVKAQSAALNAQGQAIPGCLATDNAPVNGSPAVGSCFTADPPMFLFVTAD